MSDQNFKVKNGLDVGQSGVLEYDSNSSKLRFSNDGGLTFSDFGSGGAETQVSTKTGNYTLTLDDANNIIEMNVASANTVTVPLDSSVNFPVGTQIDVVQIGAGQTEIVAASGVTISSRRSSTKIFKQYGKVTLYKSAANTWSLEGDLVRKLVTEPSHYFLQASDADSIVEFNSSSESIVFIREDAQENLPVGSRVDVVRIGAGSVVVVPQNTTNMMWITTESNFGSTNIFSVAYANNTWVAAGALGVMRTSTNGTAWTTQTSNFGSTNIQSVAFGNNTWVAGGNDGQLRTSTDAVTWVTRTSNFGTTVIISVAFGNGTWVVGGQLGQLRTSTDAVTWVTQTSNFGTTGIFSVAFADNLWVAGGNSGQLRTSTDAITWVTQNSNFGTTSIISVAFGNNLWVAGGDSGQIRTSTDAVTWVTRTSNFGSTNIRTVAFGGGVWVAGGVGNSIRSSTDAITWVTQPSNLGTTVTSISFGGGLWLASGYSGQLRVSAGPASNTVSLLSKDSNTKILSQNGVATLYKRSANTWALIGDLGI